MYLDEQLLASYIPSLVISWLTCIARFCSLSTHDKSSLPQSRGYKKPGLEPGLCALFFLRLSFMESLTIMENRLVGSSTKRA